MSLKCRLIEENGTLAWLRIYWSDDCVRQSPKGSYKSCHNAKIKLGETDTVGDWFGFGKVEDYPQDRWPTACEHCGLAVPFDSEDIKKQVFTKMRWTTDSGRPEPGDMYWVTYLHNDADDQEDGTGCVIWDDCTEKRGHLYVVCPDGSDWDIDGRASNCTMKDDREHRCWVREGEPPNVTVSKKGKSCAAGAGSIDVPGYHGFLRGGSFT